jgi:hypothetical protein
MAVKLQEVAEQLFALRCYWLSVQQRAAVAVFGSHFSKHDKCVLSQVLRVWLKFTRSRYGILKHIGVEADNSGIKLHLIYMLLVYTITECSILYILHI